MAGVGRGDRGIGVGVWDWSHGGGKRSIKVEQVPSALEFQSIAHNTLILKISL